FILWFEEQLNRFTRWISSILEWCLGHKLITLLEVVVMFFSSFILVGAGFINGEFFPSSDRGEFFVQIELPKDAAIEQTNQLTQKAEEYLSQKPEITSMITSVGQSSDGMVATLAPAYKAEIMVKLVDKEKR